jgi:hypothetical protein
MAGQDSGASVSASAPVSNTLPSNNFGFNLPTHLGTLSYSLSGSELLETGGYNSGVSTSTIASGNLAYISKSERAPFSAVYSGGYFFSTVPGSSESSTYQELALSQVFKTRSWVFVISDAVSYLPESPTTGLSGVAGVGDIGIYPVQTGIGPAEDILTNYGTQVSNGLSGSATWQLTPSVDMQGSASWQILDFTGQGTAGLNSDSYSASVGPNYRIDARDSVGGNVNYNYIYYPGFSGYKLEIEGAALSFNRAWTRRFSTSFSFGPQRTSGTLIVPIPSQINLAGTASATYATRTTGFTANYSRGVNAGSGVIFGSLSDTVSVGANRPLNRDWQLGANASYSRNVSLAPYNGVTPVYDSVFGGAQVSRRLTEALSTYGSFTVLHQTSQGGGVGINAFSGTQEIIAIGITFAPAPLLSGR